MSLINFVASLAGAGGIQAFKTMRTLRALRPLRAMSRMQGMRVRTFFTHPITFSVFFKRTNKSKKSRGLIYIYILKKKLSNSTTVLISISINTLQLQSKNFFDHSTHLRKKQLHLVIRFFTFKNKTIRFLFCIIVLAIIRKYLHIFFSKK